jgi:hypothetical protein
LQILGITQALGQVSLPEQPLLPFSEIVDVTIASLDLLVLWIESKKAVVEYVERELDV